MIGNAVVSTQGTLEELAQGHLKSGALCPIMTSYTQKSLMSVERVKFTHITRVICPRTGVHYLDGVDSNGYHWTAQMQTGVEPWIIYKEVWKKDPQQPYDL